MAPCVLSQELLNLSSEPLFRADLRISQSSPMANRYWQLSMLNSPTGLHPYSSSFCQDLSQWSSSLLPSLASHPKTLFETTTYLVFLINFCVIGLSHEDFFPLIVFSAISRAAGTRPKTLQVFNRSL